MCDNESVFTEGDYPAYHTQRGVNDEKYTDTRLREMSTSSIKTQLRDLGDKYIDSLRKDTPVCCVNVDNVVYGTVINSTPLRMSCANDKLISVPGIDIPSNVSALGWASKERTVVGSVIYGSEPMSIDSTAGGGYSLVLKPDDDILFTDSMYFSISFILSTENSTKLHPIGRGTQRTIRWDCSGRKMIKMPHSKCVWYDCAAILTRVYAYWLTVAYGQFVVAIQETEESLPYMYNNIPVERISTVFRPQDIFYMNVFIKTTYTKKRFVMDIIPLPKGIVCNTEPPDVYTHRPDKTVSLLIQNVYKLIIEANKHINIYAPHKNEKPSDGVDNYVTRCDVRAILGCTTDKEKFEQLIGHWQDYASQKYSCTKLMIDAIHFDSNIVVFSIQHVDPPVEFAREDFRCIVVGVSDVNITQDYVYTHLFNSDTYKTIKLNNIITINSKIMISSTHINEKYDRT